MTNTHTQQETSSVSSIRTLGQAPTRRQRSTKEELDRMEKELARQVDKGHNTITLLIEKTGWSRQAINRRLALMVARGELNMIYKGRGTYYELGDKAKI